MKKNAYHKSHLVRELGLNVGIPQKKVRYMLDTLKQIVYREACNEGITLPELCRFDIIRRKARKVRSPQTGEKFLIAEHDTLRVRVLKKARNAVTPLPKNLVTALPATPAPHVSDDFSKAVSFCCKKCTQEIEAPLSAVNLLAECPACGAPITVPSVSEPGTLHGPARPNPAATTGTPAATSGVAPNGADHKQKSQTIRIDLAALGFDNAGTPAPQKTLPKKRMLSFFCKNCRQEIEAPADLAGSASECPACGVSFEVPFFSDTGTLHGSDLEHKKPDPQSLTELKNRTIRIEIPDDL
ncbi:MAG: HU family DNA-binding protein [bacterium]